MVGIIKVLLIFAIAFLLFFPLVPLALKTKKKTNLTGLKYPFPENKKNAGFIVIALVEIILFALLFRVFTSITDAILKVGFIARFFDKIEASTGGRGDFVFFVILALIFNILTLNIYLFLKAIFKKKLFDPIYSVKEVIELKKQEKKEEEKAEGLSDEEDADEDAEGTAENKKNGRISALEHFATKEIERRKKKEEKRKKSVNSLTKLFFTEGSNYVEAKGWVVRIEKILQLFVYIVEALYAILFFMLLVMLFFPAEKAFFDFIVNVMGIQKWYVYPFMSLVLLQEICNTLHTKQNKGEVKDEEKKEEEDSIEEKKIRLRALQAELKKRFDSEHKLRFYPTIQSKTVKGKGEIVCSNKMYDSALKFVKNYMESISHKVVNSYMESIDAMYCDNNVYFAASFYSEFGEYIIAYTYTRLLSGSRIVFIVPEKEKKEALSSYISERLKELSGINGDCGWRIHVSGERLDQADILILSPEDFADDNIVEHYPTFFEEVCNAVFIDVDRMVSLKSYLCTIMANRLQKITENRIKFIFLTKDFLKGFAASSLPKFFCVEKVLSFSSAKENEDVAYMLWNRESKSNKVYNKNGQTLSELEYLIAEVATGYDVDGVRVMSSAPIDHATKKILENRNVEINDFHKQIPNVNYMIYDDERCNLAASVYACTRFRGKEHSIVNILSKPYLLREYFMSKIMTEDYINRSSFIQPRVTEHVDNQRLTLLKLFCNVTNSVGIAVSEFEQKVREIILMAFDKKNAPLCEFCDNMLDSITVYNNGKKVIDTNKLSKLKYTHLAAYLIAGLCDDSTVLEKDSYGNKARDYYIVIDSTKQDGYLLVKEKNITFKRVKEVFDKLLKANECVRLMLNDEVIGFLETFPNRVPVQYIVGQNILYNGTEYEIEKISEDNKTIYLRYENIVFQNCYDTIFLRRYEIKNLGEYIHKEYEEDVFRNSKNNIEEIKVGVYSGEVVGETYGFYNLMSTHQTLDFVNGVVGNPSIKEEIVANNARHLNNCKMLKVELKTKMECTDGMRLLMSAVFNEFIKTMFPYAYRCIAICPILETAISNKDAVDFNGKVKTLYPYIKGGIECETDKNRMQFLFINDCQEDVGVLNWFDDPFGNYMEEFLANVYSYLHWLSLRIEANSKIDSSEELFKSKKQAQYIFFGGETLPECFDIAGCCELFDGFNRILSDEGIKDYETAGVEEEIEINERCSFCHRPMESGRFSYFSDVKDGRFICADCQSSIISDNATLDKLNEEVCDYLHKKYPDVMWKFANATLVEVNGVEKRFLDYSFDVDGNYVIKIEQDTPRNVVVLSLVCAQVEVWQLQNGLLNSFSQAQEAFECGVLLKGNSELLGNVDDYTAWFMSSLEGKLKSDFEEISEFVNHEDKVEEIKEEPENTEEQEVEGEENAEEQTVEEEENPEESKSSKYDEFNGIRNSFAFMRLKQIELNEEEKGDNGRGDDDYSDTLYDPNKTPRFWKRYLLGLKLSELEEDERDEGNTEEEGDEDLSPEDDTEVAITEDDEKDEDVEKDEEEKGNKKSKKSKKEEEIKEEPEEEKKDEEELEQDIVEEENDVETGDEDDGEEPEPEPEDESSKNLSKKELKALKKQAKKEEKLKKREEKKQEKARKKAEKEAKRKNKGKKEDVIDDSVAEDDIDDVGIDDDIIDDVDDGSEE